MSKSILRTLIIAATGLVASGNALADDTPRTCGVENLTGLYVFSATGYIIVAGVAQPKAIVEAIRFNGDGTLTVPFSTRSINGVIDGLNHILDLSFAEFRTEGGTMIVPGHGYLSDEHEVVEYRDMVAIVRDRVQAMIKKGATLEQVKAARLTADYDTRYGANAGPWTTDMFVEAVYTSLKQSTK